MLVTSQLYIQMYTRINVHKYAHNHIMYMYFPYKGMHTRINYSNNVHILGVFLFTLAVACALTSGLPLASTVWYMCS